MSGQQIKHRIMDNEWKLLLKCQKLPFLHGMQTKLGPSESQNSDYLFEWITFSRKSAGKI